MLLQLLLLLHDNMMLLLLLLLRDGLGQDRPRRRRGGSCGGQADDVGVSQELVRLGREAVGNGAAVVDLGPEVLLLLLKLLLLL